MKKLLFLLPLFFLLSPISVQADCDNANIDDRIKCLEAQVSNLHSQAQTLADQIAYYDGQITLSTLKITQTEGLITSISSKINTLEQTLQEKSELLEKQIVATYKQGGLNGLDLLLSSSNFSNLVSRFKYSQVLQASNRRYLYDTQKIQSNYAQQKTLIQESQKKLEAQKLALSNTRRERDALLGQTKNDEVTYQKLLSQAQAERDALKSFAQYAGGGLLPPQPSPDGWYYNQRDERWGKTCIGQTCGTGNPSYVWQVGCLITSVTMLQKKNGIDVNPSQLAVNSSYFFQDLMLIPWPAQPGYKFSINYGANFGLIDSELSAGRPVIVGIRAGSQNGGKHFLVLKSKTGDGYIMNDPWEGPDLKYSQHYQTGNILSVSTYTKT